MTGLLSPGRILRGQHGFYTVTGQLRDRIWTAMSENKEKVILKTTTASRLQTEKSALLYLQYKTPHVRPLVDDLSGESDLPPTLVLKQMDDDVLAASTTDQWPLWRPDIKYIAKGVLEALAVIHEEGWVHTDINPANILVNYKRNHHLLENPNPKRLRDPMRCTDVRLCGFGAAVHKKFSADALLNPQIGSPIYRSPEALLRLKWDTATDIWSFGVTLITILTGKNNTPHPLKPDVPPTHREYTAKLIQKHHRLFGPFPESYGDFGRQDQMSLLYHVVGKTPLTAMRPFLKSSPAKVRPGDSEFLCKVMTLDPRDRPDARTLLEDKWFDQY